MENIYSINKCDFADPRLQCNMPHELSSLYDSYQRIKCEYNNELNDVLILSRPRNLKLFFRGINDRLKFIKSEIQTFDRNDITDYILSDINQFIAYNLNIAMKNMKVEKPYSFSSNGILDHRDPELLNRVNI